VATIRGLSYLIRNALNKNHSMGYRSPHAGEYKTPAVNFKERIMDGNASLWKGFTLVSENLVKTINISI
jgi:hypothetical protein